jgi:sigma-B regulation protein RsbU (phosphoserine phosphatase)
MKKNKRYIMRILVVEDSSVTRLMIERILKNWHYDVIAVDNIDSATDIILKEKIQFVITDWIMPGGNGTVLCQRIRAKNLPFYTYMILLTSLEDTKSAIQGIESGADDYIRKPFHHDELRARIRAGERILLLEKTLTETNKQLLATREIINRDLKTAAGMQRSLLPPKLLTIRGISIDWIFQPSMYLSGDIFNFFPLNGHHIGFYIIDVAGHGIASAMLSFTLSRLLSPDVSYSSHLKFSSPETPLSQLIRPASTVVQQLNQQFQTNEDNLLFFTMIYGVIDTTLQTIELCQAGHPSLIYQQKDKEPEFIANSGLPVGVIAHENYESVLLNYHTGDRLFLYSDGIIECESPSGEMFGKERLREFIDKNRHLNISEIMSKLDQVIYAWRKKNSFEDDISMLVLEIGVN